MFVCSVGKLLLELTLPQGPQVKPVSSASSIHKTNTRPQIISGLLLLLPKNLQRGTTLTSCLVVTVAANPTNRRAPSSGVSAARPTSAGRTASSAPNPAASNPSLVSACSLHCTESIRVRTSVCVHMQFDYSGTDIKREHVQSSIHSCVS
jgi:hypothetical protein